MKILDNRLSQIDEMQIKRALTRYDTEAKSQLNPY
jgi:hypothetical protein